MTGVASELEILKVIELVSERLAAEEKTDFDRAIQGANSIARKSRVLFEKLEQQRRDLPQDIRELDLWLNAIFNIIRIYRNDAGHPVGVAASREEIYTLLTQFRLYSRNLSGLKRHLRAGDAS
jgi:hypothetical protein